MRDRSLLEVEPAQITVAVPVSAPLSVPRSLPVQRPASALRSTSRWRAAVDRIRRFVST